MVVSSVDDAFYTAFQCGVAAAHQAWIRGTTLDTFITVGQNANIPVPLGAFMTENGTESQLTLIATQADGSSLPEWLSFNSQDRVFNGIAPENSFNSLDLKVIGRDAYGHEAEVDIHVVIGHQHQLSDMIDVQETSRAIQQAFDVIQNDVNRLFLDSQFAPLNGHSSPHPHGKPSLRSQLRHMGAKARQRDARALLDKQARQHAEL
ncbi:putative Ig domain-containing protein [Gluconacetobacter sacchari]|uniref:putative Ig domain-containing protein n=1 Tax=Gluconacetobacter sacchari TaxID=92759 RepID=UPI0039B6AA06